jgi:hypothetical protein
MEHLDEKALVVPMRQPDTDGIIKYSVPGKHHPLSVYGDTGNIASKLLVLRQRNSDGSQDLIYVEQDNIESLERAIAEVKKELSDG